MTYEVLFTKIAFSNNYSFIDFIYGDILNQLFLKVDALGRKDRNVFEKHKRRISSTTEQKGANISETIYGIIKRRWSGNVCGVYRRRTRNVIPSTFIKSSTLKKLIQNSTFIKS